MKRQPTVAVPSATHKRVAYNEDTRLSTVLFSLKATKMTSFDVETAIFDNLTLSMY